MVDKWLTRLADKYERASNSLDVFHETSFIEKYYGDINPVYQRRRNMLMNREKMNNFIDRILVKFSDCFTPEKTKCKYQHVRFHYSDLRLSDGMSDILALLIRPDAVIDYINTLYSSMFGDDNQIRTNLRIKINHEFTRPLYNILTLWGLEQTLDTSMEELERKMKDFDDKIKLSNQIRQTIRTEDLTDEEFIKLDSQLDILTDFIKENKDLYKGWKLYKQLAKITDEKVRDKLYQMMISEYAERIATVGIKDAETFCRSFEDKLLNLVMEKKQVEEDDLWLLEDFDHNLAIVDIFNLVMDIYIIARIFSPMLITKDSIVYAGDRHIKRIRRLLLEMGFETKFSSLNQYDLGDISKAEEFQCHNIEDLNW